MAKSFGRDGFRGQPNSISRLIVNEGKAPGMRMGKGMRPGSIEYDPVLAEEILERLADGDSLASIVTMKGCPMSAAFDAGRETRATSAAARRLFARVCGPRQALHDAFGNPQERASACWEFSLPAAVSALGGNPLASR
jgi:hypothetical protein